MILPISFRERWTSLAISRVIFPSSASLITSFSFSDLFMNYNV
jgi:hypothetical protein